MKRFAIAVVVFVGLLSLTGSAKADTITYNGASGSASGFGAPWSGSGSFSSSSLGPGSQSFSFNTFFNVGGGLSSITIGSGATAFTGIFAGGFTNTGSCGGLCTVWSANLVGVGGSAGETGFITLDLTFDLFSGKWVITGGTADPETRNVPESGTLGMFAAGLAGLGLLLGRKQKALPITA